MKPTAPFEDNTIPLAEPTNDPMDTENEPLSDSSPLPDVDDGAEPTSMDAGLDADENEFNKAAAGSPITGRYNSSPVGDVKLTKAAKTYNTYKLELSMGQLEVILNALEKNHADPVSDELLATFQWYLNKLPGPGEEEEEAEARNNPQAAAKLAGGDDEADTPIPMPPGGAAGTGKPDLSKLPSPSDANIAPGKARMLKNAGGPKGRSGLPGPDTETGGAPAEALPPPPEE